MGTVPTSDRQRDTLDKDAVVVDGDAVGARRSPAKLELSVWPSDTDAALHDLGGIERPLRVEVKVVGLVDAVTDVTMFSMAPVARSIAAISLDIACTTWRRPSGPKRMPLEPAARGPGEPLHLPVLRSVERLRSLTELIDHGVSFEFRFSVDSGRRRRGSGRQRPQTHAVPVSGTPATAPPIHPRRVTGLVGRAHSVGNAAAATTARGPQGPGVAFGRPVGCRGRGGRASGAYATAMAMMAPRILPYCDRAATA